MESEIRIKDWFDQDFSPVNVEDPGVGQSMEEYWAKMTLSYAEMETGSLDDYDDEDGGDDYLDDDEYDDQDDDEDDDPIEFPDHAGRVNLGGLFGLDTGFCDEDEESDDGDYYENGARSDDNDDEQDCDVEEPGSISDFEDHLLRKYISAPVKSLLSTSANDECDYDIAPTESHMGVADDLLGIEQEWNDDMNDGDVAAYKYPLGVATGCDKDYIRDAPKKNVVAGKKSRKVIPEKRPANNMSAAGKKKPPKKSTSRSAFDAEMKHKVWLLSMVEKKRQEEEEIMNKIEKAERNRKKFKEALLERARAKQQAQTAEVSHTRNQEPPEPIKKKPSKPRPKPVVVKEKDQNDLTAKEGPVQGETEEEGRAQMQDDAMKARKKFKKHHKKILEALKIKKEEEEKKLLELLEKDEKLKEKMRKRNEKMIRKRQEKNEQEEDCKGNVAPSAAGSGVSAVRASRSQGGEDVDLRLPKPPRRSRSVSSSGKEVAAAVQEGAGGNTLIPKFKRSTTGSVVPEDDKEGESDDAEENPLEKERRLERIRLRQAKVTAHINAIAEQRRLAGEKERLKEERMKRRAEIRAQRVLQENAERKLMAKEDKYTNPGSTGDAMVTKPEASGNTENDAPRKKITPEMADAMASRLQAKTKDGTEVAMMKPAARDFDDWKKKNSVPPTGRVFCMTGWYPCVKTALQERGWYFNPDPASPYFDLKWTLRSSDIGLENLHCHQLTNHFMKNIALTTKVGLLKSLQQLVWMADVSPDDIIPRGYDLTNSHEIQEYIDDFRIQQAQCVLKGLYFKATGLKQPFVVQKNVLRTPRVSEDVTEKSATDDEYDEEVLADVPPAIVNLDELLVNDAVFAACCSVLNRHLKPYYTDAYIDSASQIDDSYAVSPLEWELIDGYDIYRTGTLRGERPEAIDEFLQDKKDADAVAHSSATGKQREAAVAAHRKLRLQQRYDDRSRQVAAEAVKRCSALSQEKLSHIHTLLSRCNSVSGSQYSLNGSGDSAMNMWIVKPAAKSRGRGIATFCDLKKLLDYVELGRTGKNTITSSHWIVQKYMENASTIGKHKFDMRQWVLVTDWNPLTIYFYDEFYARFSVEEYSNSEEAMENSFIHLVNNSIGKTSERFGETFVAENGEVVSGYMWSHSQLCSYVCHASGDSSRVEQMINRMKDIAVWSLMCGSDAIEHRKNSWELYGLDFMLDEDFTPWLIEINSSPACDYSTPITERYVKKALVELLDVVLDVREWEMQSKKSRGDKPKTGGWENIYTGPFVETPASSFGTDMTVKGELLKVPKKKTATNVFGVCSPPRVDAPDSNTPSVPVVKSLKPKRTEDARTPAVTKSAMVKFDMDGDSDQDELSNIARKLGNPTGVSNPPTVAARASQLQRGNNIVNSSNLQTPKAEIDPSAVSTQPLSGRVAASSSLKEVDEFPDFDDSDSDGQSQCRLTAKAVDPKNSGRPQVVKCAAKKVQNVPDGVAVIPIKTFSMEL